MFDDDDVRTAKAGSAKLSLYTSRKALEYVPTTGTFFQFNPFQGHTLLPPADSYSSCSSLTEPVVLSVIIISHPRALAEFSILMLPRDISGLTSPDTSGTQCCETLHPSQDTTRRVMLPPSSPFLQKLPVLTGGGVGWDWGWGGVQNGKPASLTASKTLQPERLGECRNIQRIALSITVKGEAQDTLPSPAAGS